MQDAQSNNPARPTRKLLAASLIVGLAGAVGLFGQRGLVELPDLVAAIPTFAENRAGDYPIRIALRETRPVGMNLAWISPAATGDAGPPEAKEPGANPSESAADEAAADRDGDAAGKASRAPPSETQGPVTRATPAKFLKLAFSIANVQNSGNAIDVQKMIQTRGLDKGKVKLRIASDATILVSSNDLISVMGDELSAEAIAALNAARPADGFTDFNSLRAAGLDIRYDPVRDRLLIATSTPKA
jgi:hypothetical protein